MHFFFKSAKQSLQLCLITVLLLILAFPAKGMAQTSFTGNGAGTTGDPYEITTEAQLKEIAQGPDYHYILMNDIPLEDDLWQPIPSFTGSLNGNGFKITNLTIMEFSFAGLFETNEGTISNLGVEVASIEGYFTVGTIAATNKGEITNCFVTGGTISIAKAGSVGGIAGVNNNIISNCYVALKCVQRTVSAPDGTTINMGGIAGYMAEGASVNYCLVANEEMSVGDATSGNYVNYIVGGELAEEKFLDDNKLNFFSYKVLRTGLFYNMINPDKPQGMSGQLWSGSFPTEDACKWTKNDAGEFCLKGPDGKEMVAINPSDHLYLAGEGTTDAPYQIKDEADLIKLSDYVNKGGNSEYDVCYKLLNDISMSEVPFFPIGKYRGGQNVGFCGIFDGGGYCIENLKLDNDGINNVGLFGSIGVGAKIRNLAVTVCSIDITHRGGDKWLSLAPIVGNAEEAMTATIENCYTTGTIHVTSDAPDPFVSRVYVGGIAGACNCPITNCYSDVTITVDVRRESYTSYIGGITGFASSTVTNCLAKGAIEAMAKAGGELYCGGIVGEYTGDPIQNCLALNPSIKATTPSYVSQIALKNKGIAFEQNTGNYASQKMELYKNGTRYMLVSDTDEAREGKYVEEDGSRWQGELPSDGAWEKVDGYVNLISIAETFGLKEQVKLSDYVPFAITLSETIANGTLAADPTAAFEGDKVTLTAVPNPGYKLMESSLKYNDTQIVAVDGVYGFTMPSKAVTLSAVFATALTLDDIPDGGNSVLISHEAGDKTWWYEVKTTETKALRLVDSKIPFNGIITGTLADNKALVMGATCQDEITFANVTVPTFIIEEGAAVVLSGASELTYTTAENNGGSLVAKSGAKITDDTGTTIKTSAVTITAPTNGTLIVQVGNAKLVSGDQVTEDSKFTVTATPSAGYETASLQVMQGTIGLTATNGVYTMPGEAITIKATFNRIEVTPPTPPATVYHTVTLPALIGAVTNPAAGRHEVERWNNFLFVLTLDADYSQSIPLVKANGTVVAPRPSDGKYVISSVREDQTITIDGIVKNTPPVGNAEIETDNRIYTANSVLYIQVAQPTEAQIVTFGGSVLRSLSLPAGQTTVIGLGQGLYIVRLGNGTTQKVKL